MPLRKIQKLEAEGEELVLYPEDKYQFINGKTYKCLSCHIEVTDRLRHISEALHNSFYEIKNEYL
jgi:hypothetical protein